MECGSGCCGGQDACAPARPTSTSPDNISSLVEEPAPDAPDRCNSMTGVPRLSASGDCCDGCCEPESGAQDKPTSSSMACCQSSRTIEGASDDCCASDEPAGGIGASGKSSESLAPSTPGQSAPDCCKGKPRPCCDDSCLDRLALRECESLGSATDAGSGCQKRESGRPCIDHKRKTLSVYASKLQALGCICRVLVDLGQASCCATPSRRQHPSQNYHVGPTRFSVDPQCRGNKSGCCDATKDDQRTSPARQRSGKGYANADLCAAAPADDIRCYEQPVPDVEKGIRKSHKEHVVLSISGMTCTGCETKLARVLSIHPAVTNLKTSLVLSRAEFHLAIGTSVADVIRHLERTTEFTGEKITNKGSSLEFSVPFGSASAAVDKPWPGGVLEVRAIGKATIRLTFDAKRIGARDLAERGCGDGPLVLAPPRADPTLEAGSRHVRRVGFMALLSALLTIPVLVLAWGPLPERPVAYDSASLALATVVQVVIAGPFYVGAFKALVFSRVIEMDLLVVLSTTAAYVFSVVSFVCMIVGHPLSTGQFFETSTLLVTLIMVGRWGAALARQKAVESISIRSLQVAKATVVLMDGREAEMDARLLQYGDVFRVAPDSKVPTDGTVLSGSSEVDESMITGESRPVVKLAKSPLVAGSVNGPGTMHARVARLPGENTISAIAAMVDEAKLSKPKIQSFADKAASYFVPVVVCLTVVTFCTWVAIGITVRRQSAGDAAIAAITYAITVLIVSCPCAVGLAVPMVIVIASGIAAQRGVIFKSAESIEVMHKTTHVVFDKTGTLTNGKLAVVSEWYSEHGDTTTKSLLLGLVEGIKHPVSISVAQHLKEHGTTSASEVINKTSLAGKGVEGTATYSGQQLRAGNCRWLNLAGNAKVQSMLAGGHTTFCFTINGAMAAIFSLEDSVRPDSTSAVANLINTGVSVHMVSGDEDNATCSVASQLGIPLANVRSLCSPAEKREYVQALLAAAAETPHTPPVVVFCGDGTNDAAAIAQATVGVHMNEGGTDVAQSAADVVLMRPDPGGILIAISVSRLSMRRIFFNFGWSFVYNLFAILLAGGAFVHARIPPAFAGLGELVSVLPVVVAASLLHWAKI